MNSTSVRSTPRGITATTDENGDFTLISNVDGDATVCIAPASDHHVAYVPVGQLSSSDGVESIVLRTDAAGSRVKLTGADGQSFAGLEVGLLHVSYGDIQPNVSYVLGRDSALPSRLLIEGETYSVLVLPKRGALPVAKGRVTWNGEPELVLPALLLGGSGSSK